MVSQNSLDIELCPNSHPNSLYSAVKPGLNRPQAIWSWGTLNQRDSGCLGYLITTPSPAPPGNAQHLFAGILAQIGRKGGLQRSHVSCQPVVMGCSTLAVKGRGQASCEGHVLHSRPPPLPALASLGALTIPISFITLEQATLRPSGTTRPPQPQEWPFPICRWKCDSKLCPWPE